MSLPHNYIVTATGAQDGIVKLGNESLPELDTTPPPNFGGPEGYWTPEDLFVGAVADCFILTFRAMSRMQNIDWSELQCEANGTLDKEGSQMLFTGIHLKTTVTVPEGSDVAKVERVLNRSEQNCLITNSLKCPTTIEVNVNVG
jgi:organic hydroperoxide reductase OsmC/OhrA